MKEEKFSIKIHIIECGSIEHPVRAAKRVGLIGGLFSHSEKVTKIVTKIAESDATKIATQGAISNNSNKASESAAMLPVHAFLIEHPLGNVLVDTGVDGRVIGKLEELGFGPSDIDVITCSCSDADHTGGLKPLLKTAAQSRLPRILFADEELYWMQRNQFKKTQPIENIGDVKHERFFFKACADGPHHYKFDVFGDESVMMYLCTGHTFGTFATVVTNNKTGRKAVLASDIVLDAETFEESTVFHRINQDKSVAWLKAQAADPNCVAILPTHGTHSKLLIEF